MEGREQVQSLTLEKVAMASLKQVSDGAKELVANLSGILLFVLVFGVIIYGTLALVAYTLNPSQLTDFRRMLDGDRLNSLGIPCCAIAAYGIVTALLHTFPPAEHGGQITLKAFGLEFTGPAGPITLWLACFLSFIGAIKLLMS
jgi:hypothetical protein